MRRKGKFFFLFLFWLNNIYNWNAAVVELKSIRSVCSTSGQRLFCLLLNTLDIESIVDAEGFVYRKIAIRKFATEMSSTFISEAILACGGSGFSKILTDSFLIAAADAKRTKWRPGSTPCYIFFSQKENQLFLS